MTSLPGSLPGGTEEPQLSSIVPEPNKVGDKAADAPAADDETDKLCDEYEKGHPEYFNMLTKAIFVVGLNKCITPASLLLLSLVFLGIDLSVEVQHIFEQMAGGLLIYTWGVKCMSPIQEAYKEAAVATGIKKNMVPAIGIGICIIFSFASLFFIGTSGDTITGSIFMHGVKDSDHAPKCNDKGHPVTTTDATSSCSLTGLARARPARQNVAGAACPKTSEISLLPYFIGFALDAIMLVLVDSEEELVGTYRKIKENYLGCIVDLLVAPIAFSLDNFLSGAGVCTIVLAAADGSKGGAVFTFFLFALSCAVGVPIAFAMRGVEEILMRQGLQAVALWVKFSFLLCIAISFLDNGLSLCNDGLTYWVGIGGCTGWLLYMIELGMEGEEEEENGT